MDAKEQHASSKAGKLPSTGSPRRPKTLKLYHHDLPDAIAKRLLYQPTLSLDTETGGLDPREDPLLMVQVATAGRQVYIVRFPDDESDNLIRVLTYPFNRKIFHHAGFDLRFIKAGLRLEVGGQVDCTKVLMKMVNPYRASGLGAAVRFHFGVNLDKDVDHDCWKRPELTEKEIKYAANDVLYLDHMANVMRAQLDHFEQQRYIKAMQAVKDSASLEVEGYTDLLGYKKDKGSEVVKNRNWWDNLYCREDKYGP